MSCVTFKDICSKEVVCTCDGARLGFINDFEADLSSGCIQAFLLPDSRGFSFSRKAKYRVNRSCIERIGEDVILVRGYEVLGGKDAGK